MAEMYEFAQCCRSEDSLNVGGPAAENALPEVEQPVQKKRSNKAKKANKMKHDDLMRMQAWREHRKRVLNVQSELDAKPPGIQAVRMTGVNSLRLNADVYMERVKNNVQMLVGISKTMRTHGVIKPFRHERIYTMSSLPAAIKQLERVDAMNRDIAKRLLDVVSEVDTGLKSKGKKPKKRSRQSVKPFTMCEKSLVKYKGYNINMPLMDKERWQLFRPHIFFDIYLKDARPLGRIVIQLYTEAAPLVVLTLVRAAICNAHNKFVIRRLFPNLWMDVQLHVPANSELFQPLEYDAKIIDHGAPGNVLSFSKEHVQGFRDFMSFSLSFKPISVANGSRVGFGHVVVGTKMLSSLQSYGTKNGKLSRDIVFTSCGLL